MSRAAGLRARHGTPVPRGRPRSPAIDEAILQAAFRLMAAHGYARTSVDAIADAAGVTKPTIYLRFPGGKTEIATKALAYARDRRPVPEAGDTRADLIAHVRRFRAGVSRPFGMAMVGTVLAEEHDTPQLLAFFRTHVIEPRRVILRAALSRARDLGELRPDADIEMGAQMLVGAYYAQYLAGTPFRDGWDERVVDMVLAALGCRQRNE
ncbi:MAG TPA: TetR/AcrR family transcriptional regulator [bacterium]|nr:TetR/AcrR family transcriptional regulator [bacterium]